MGAFKKGSDRRRKSPLNSKVPLTYYRSAPASADSPFRGSSPKKPSRRFRRFFNTALSIALVALIVMALVYSLLVRPSPQLLISSQLYHPAGVYKAYATHELQSFGNHNKISFNQSSVIQALRTKFPEIVNASLELPIFSQNPTIRLSISEPSLFLDSQNSRYIVDDQGVAVVKATEIPAIKGLTPLTDQSGFATSPGRQVLTSQDVAFIKFLAAQCRGSGVPIESLTLPPLANQLNLRTRDHQYYVKFFLSGDPLRQIGQFIAARHQFEVNHKQPSQYLDVRIAGKVFYK